MRQRAASPLPARMSRVLCALVAGVLACGSTAQAQARPPAPTPVDRFPRTWESTGPARDWYERLETWVAAVRGHRTGANDAHVLTAASLPRPQLFAIYTDLKAIRERLGDALRVRALPRGFRDEISYGGRRVRIAVLRDMLGVSEDDAAAGNLNELTRRGALLHADVAYHAPPVLATAASASEAAVLLQDGQQVGYEYSGVHWEFARMLLDLTVPGPSEDPDVRRWYVAAAELMRRQYSHGYGAPQLQRARKLFADDARVQFLSGCLHEALAAPRVQGFLRVAEVNRWDISGAGDETRRAESFFKRAVELAPGDDEARIRYGRALLLRGRPADAVGHLRLALERTTEPTLVYFAALFLGDAEQALGDRAAAQAAYEHAQAQFPDAQSPYLALAQLARRFGDRSGAVGAVEGLFELPVRAELRPDPWWNYFGGTLGQDNDLLLAVWNALPVEEEP